MVGFPTNTGWVWVNPDHVVAIESTGDRRTALVRCVGDVTYLHRGGASPSAAKRLARVFNNHGRPYEEPTIGGPPVRVCDDAEAT